MTCRLDAVAPEIVQRVIESSLKAEADGLVGNVAVDAGGHLTIPVKDPSYAAFRPALEDEERLRAYLAYRDRVFPAPRPLDHYLDALRTAGFELDEVTERTIEADVEEWYEFLAAYADAVLGWAGGSAKVDGAAALWSFLIGPQAEMPGRKP